MKKKNCIKALSFLLPLLLLTSCEKDKLLNQVGVDFTATMEQPNSGDSKVRLVNEQWIYWEPGDTVSIGSNMSTTDAEPEYGFLTGVNQSTEDFNQYNGVFHTSLPEGSIYFLALHPHSTYNRIKAGSDNKFSVAKIYLNPVQPYRDDSTFAKKVLPMVAWYGGEWGQSVPNLDFHNLAGLLRLQFFNATGEDGYKITSITVTERDSKQLCGMFSVEHRYSFNPRLHALNTAANGENINQLTLTMPEGGLTFNNNNLKSFYLVLPALHGMDTATTYNLSITVNATKTGSDSYTFTKGMTNVGTRRNGITYTRAVGVTEFKNVNSDTETGLVGNGTKERPFKIYSYGDLQYLRNCFNVSEGEPVYVNGQEVTEETEFRIMRSDIELTTSNWNADGIKQFKGHMTYYSNASVALHGVTNHSSYPLFKSISTQGVVEGLTIKCDGVYYHTGQYSPFCETNRGGKIIDCHVTTPSGKSMSFGGTDFGGICITNRGSGLIQGSSCSVIGTFRCNNFGGICLNNTSYSGATPTIQGCVAASPMSVSGVTYAAGICHTNKANVEDCYTDIHYTTGSTDWGGIVYQNENGGVVKHCYVSQSAIIHSDVVGGIVCNNAAGGTVDYCWSHGELRGTHVGGIASTVSGGELRNCFVDDGLCIFTLLASASPHCAGGLVAEFTGGDIKNSYVHMHHIATLDFTGINGAFVGKMTGGTITNCYSYEQNDLNPDFYGSKTGGSFSSCWLVTSGSSQAGLTGTYTDAQLGALKTSLDDGRPSDAKYHTWESGPKLSPYTLSGH